jgi:hypothetical protein
VRRRGRLSRAICCSTPSFRSRTFAQGPSVAPTSSRLLARAIAAGLRQVDTAGSVGPRGGSARRVGDTRPLRRRSRGPAHRACVRVRPILAGKRRPGRRRERSRVSVLGRAAPRLASVFRTSPAPFVLMLDDLHEPQSPACHDVLGRSDLGDSPRLAGRRIESFRAASCAAAAGLGRRAGARGERPGPSWPMD